MRRTGRFTVQNMKAETGCTLPENMYSRISLQKKFLIVVIASVIASIAVLTILVIRHDTMLLQADHKKNAEVVIAAISKALKNNMLKGRPEETRRLIGELSHVEGVS